MTAEVVSRCPTRRAASGTSTHLRAETRRKEDESEGRVRGWETGPPRSRDNGPASVYESLGLENRRVDLGPASKGSVVTVNEARRLSQPEGGLGAGG